MDTINEEIVLMDFTATWCSPCKALSPIIDSLYNYSDRVKIMKIDVDENADLSADYNIRSVPTLVFLKNGIEVDRILGLVSREKIVKKLETLIK